MPASRRVSLPHSESSRETHLSLAEPGPEPTRRLRAAAGVSAAAAIAAASGLLLGSGACFAHGEATPDVSVTAPLPEGFLAENVRERTQVRGAHRVRIRAELDSQVYRNGGQQHYLLVDAIVRVPTPELGISSRATAQAATLTLGLFHAGATTPYAECTLVPRTVSGSSATYSVGLKANALMTMLRWGHCDDPGLPGFDSMFPYTENGDVAKLTGPGGQAIAQFEAPLAFDQPVPPRPRKKPQPAIAKTMETGSYRVKKQ
jgi:hypothetical protein